MEGKKSEILLSLAKQLRLYKPTYSLTSPTDQQEEEEEDGNLTDSQNLDSSARTTNKRAAVLVCIFEGNEGDLRVFLTKRSSTLSSHSGEVSLPGGKRDQADADDIQTALREAKEEIGLDPCLVDVVTVLEPFVTLRGIAVVPVVGILYNTEAFKPSPNPSEVESIFHVPIEMFLKNENRRAEEVQRMGYNYLLHFFNYESGNKSYVIWAFTAGIMIRVASIVYQRLPAFVEMSPPFWRGVSQKDIPRL